MTQLDSRLTSILLPDLLGGGAERFNLNLAHEFAAQGHRVEFVLMQARGDLLAEAQSRHSVFNLACPRARSLPRALARYLRPGKNNDWRRLPHRRALDNPRPRPLLRPGLTTAPAGFATSPVVIGKNVWIGAKATVTKGVSIGDNSVIGANSVVTRNIPANSVAVGTPARVIHTIKGGT